MSEILYWAHEVKGLTTKQRVVLTCLANMADRKGGDCYPKIETLVERTGLSRATVFRALDELEAAGFVAREAQTVGDSNWKRNNKYILPNASVCASTRVAEVSQRDVKGSHTETSRGLTERRQEPPTNNHPLKHSDNTVLLDEFEIWWRDLVPERDGPNPKKVAKERYIRFRKKGVSKDAIWNATHEYRNMLAANGTEPRFIKQAATWLNTEPWVK